MTPDGSEARRALEAGGTGRACAETLSAETDEFCASGSKCPRAGSPRRNRARPLPTIVAVGGYGRGMLAPFSDVDVLFLLPDKSPPGVEKVVEALLYVLWDLKLKVGHATRTVDECLKQARADMTIRTTLLEARFITGDKALFETLRARFDKEIVAKTAAEFVAAKLAEREARVRKAGASRYLVEPNVKEGKGGLRDLNTLFWISKYVYRVHNARELVAAGLFSPREFALLPPLRGIPLDRAVPAPLSRRPGGGAPELRRPAADRPPARLFDPRGPDRRRAVHEALFPYRQGRRRSDRDRVRGARGATRQADACVRPPRRTPPRRRTARSRTPRISRSTTIASTSSATTSSSAIR